MTQLITWGTSMGIGVASHYPLQPRTGVRLDIRLGFVNRDEPKKENIMASWEDELKCLLAQLGVVLENEPQRAERSPDLCLVQISRDYPGVTYRVEQEGATLHLRVFVPTDTGPYKMRIYLVQLQPHIPPGHQLHLVMTRLGGSPAFRSIDENYMYHLVSAYSEIMKALFWKGDMTTMSFPPEITVQHLL